MASKVHRFCYYNPKPQPINCVSLNKSSKHLALARGDASIEIWDLNYAPFLLKFIPGVKDGSVEALGWVNERLLSTGLGGALIEWDLDKLCLKTTVLLTGYAAWCLDVNQDSTVVAIGTEQGYINLYSVEDGDIVYKKLFDKQEGRILCCKFNKTGNILVTGSINTIRVWNAETGHAINRMSVSRRGRDVIVWSLAVLTDNTIISGDSLGRLTFWDGTLGEQIESNSTHKGDILSVAVSDDETNLFCSGMDPVIVNFIKLNKSTDKQSEARWVKNVHRNIHQHDVRDLVMCNEKLISVGIDGYLTFSSFPPKWVMRVPPMIPAGRSSVCCKKKLLLLRYSDYLEVWKLGSYAITDSGNLITNISTKHDDTNLTETQLEEDSTIDVINKASKDFLQNQSLKLTEKPVKLITVQAKGKRQIKCCELSPNGELIVYSTATEVRMLKLENDEEQNNVSVSKVSMSGVPVPAGGCERAAFTGDSAALVAHCAATAALLVLQLDPEAGATLLQTIPLDKHFKTKSILHLYISKPSVTDTTYLVVADTQGAIAVWTRNAKKFEFYVSLPKYHCVPSALTVDSQRENLIVTYVDQKIVEYELKNKKLSDWPGSALPPAWVSRQAAVAAAHAHPARDALVFHDETALWIMERKTQDECEPEPKRKLQPGGRNVGLKVLPIKYLADFHWLDKDEAVTIEVLPENIVSQLPPPIPANKFAR